MGDFIGIAGVTRTLRRLLRDRMREAVPVTALPLSDGPDPRSGVRLNLFLYRVTQDPTLRGADLPVPGTSLSRPPITPDLHYLLSAQGPESSDDTIAQHALDEAMFALDQHPVVDGDLRRRNEPRDRILDPVLTGRVDQLRISNESLDLDRLVQLWLAAGAPYRLSVGYQVRAVPVRPPAAPAERIAPAPAFDALDPPETEGRPATPSG